MITRYTIERVTGLEGQFLYYLRRSSRRPYIRIIDDCPPFEDAKATFEVEVKPGRPDRYIRRVD